MSDLEDKHVKAVEVLERLTARFENGEWILPPISVLPHEYTPMFKRGRESARRKISTFGSQAEALKARRENTSEWQAFEAEHRRLMETPAEKTITENFYEWRKKTGQL